MNDRLIIVSMSELVGALINLNVNYLENTTLKEKIKAINFQTFDANMYITEENDSIFNETVIQGTPSKETINQDKKKTMVQIATALAYILDNPEQLHHFQSFYKVFASTSTETLKLITTYAEELAQENEELNKVVFPLLPVTGVQQNQVIETTDEHHLLKSLIEENAYLKNELNKKVPLVLRKYQEYCKSSSPLFFNVGNVDEEFLDDKNNASAMAKIFFSNLSSQK